MTRTRPHNRIRHVRAPDPPALPKPSAEGHAVAVHAALAALVGKLHSADERIVLAAATAILDLEKTRLRHARAVAGTHPPAAATDDDRNEPADDELPDADQKRLLTYAKQVHAEADDPTVTFHDVCEQVEADLHASGLSVSDFLLRRTDEPAPPVHSRPTPGRDRHRTSHNDQRRDLSAPAATR